MGNNISIGKLGEYIALIGGLLFLCCLIFVIYFIITTGKTITGEWGISKIETDILVISLLMGIAMILIGCGIMEFFPEPEKTKKDILNESVDEIVRIYIRNPNGFIMRSPESQPLRDIGQKLADAGGMDLMLQAHKMAVKRGVNGRNLEACWDGIGGWAG